MADRKPGTPDQQQLRPAFSASVLALREGVSAGDFAAECKVSSCYKVPPKRLQ